MDLMDAFKNRYNIFANTEASKEEASNREVLVTIEKDCCDCGAHFTISPAEQKFYNGRVYKLPERCPKCRKKRQMYEEHRCVDCEATFMIRQTDKEFYEKHHLFVPKRCEKCREIKRKRNAEQTQ